MERTGNRTVQNEPVGLKNLIKKNEQVTSEESSHYGS